MNTQKPNILFLCTGNACRSQMAEGWTRLLFSEKVNAFSAGVSPHGVNPYATQVMMEKGANMSSHTSKHVDTLNDISFDLVFTVCDNAKKSCPLYPKPTITIHHNFPDPPALAKKADTPDQALDAYRLVRDQIHEYLLSLPRILEEHQL